MERFEIMCHSTDNPLRFLPAIVMHFCVEHNFHDQGRRLCDPRVSHHPRGS